MLTVAGFLAKYPEFGTASDLIQVHLDDARKQLDPAVWGDKYFDIGHGLLTAHSLAISPSGTNARLSSNAGESTYGTQYKDLVRQVACGIRVF